MPFTILYGDSFVSDGTAKKILLPGNADYFKFVNQTQTPLAGTTCIAGEWYGAKFGAGATAVNDGTRWRKAASNAVLIDTFQTAVASNGFTYVATTPVIEAQNAAAITAITAATPAVVTQAAHGYSNGDIIQFYGTTGMLQISGLNFQISGVTANSYTLVGLAAAGFAAPATAGFTRRISKFLAVDPQFLFITAVSKATQMVVTFSVDPSAYYVVGMKMEFSIPFGLGMTELNSLTGTILSINAATYQMTFDINSTAFTTFVFPVSAQAALTPLFATAAPAGASTKRDPNTFVETGYNFQYQAFKTGQFTPYMVLGGGGAGNATGAIGDVINYIAYKLEN